MTDFSTAPDYFDSREVIERIAELEQTTPLDRDEDEQEELDALYELAEAADGNVADWQYGETFISDDYFEKYVEELVKDIGSFPADFPSWIVVDWQETADNIRVDYNSFEFRGTTYYAR